MSDRRRFAVLLVALAALLTLGHLLGPQSDLHAVAAQDHEIEHDHAEKPSHDHGAHACGLATIPDATVGAFDDIATETVDPEVADRVALVGLRVDVRDRSPTDPISELQVNRV